MLRTQFESLEYINLRKTAFDHILPQCVLDPDNTPGGMNIWLNFLEFQELTKGKRMKCNILIFRSVSHPV